ncbi:MAG: BLUF domain-containing protein [Bdellovibrionia bacterium]
MMKNPLFAIVYTSQARSPVTEKLLNEILCQARERNEKDQITGFLAARTGYFLQFLEGEKNRVQACYRRIQKDERHTQIITQAEMSLGERFMPDWSMGLAQVDESQESIDSLLLLFEKAREGKPFSDPRAIKKMLSLFCKNIRLLGASDPKKKTLSEEPFFILA